MNAGNLEIGICDDSPEDLKRIRMAFCRSAEMLGEKNISLYLYPDGRSLYKDSRNRNFSLVFLDWEMPELDGFNLAERLYIENPKLKVVFVSNYENMVFDSYEYTPLWFVRKSALARDMMKALQKYFNMTIKTQLRYRMTDGFGLRDVHLESIMYAECSGHTVMVHMRDQTTLQMHGTLKSYEEEWSSHGFLRIHKNYLANVRYIMEVGTRTIRLSDGTELDMGKNRRRKIAELVKQEKERTG
ncbi:MAG: response regulator transcription factor [Lachnospiraceae bacterium]|nr:response regulator transcription factor [Lachnospiraceae bacterium]